MTSSRHAQAKQFRDRHARPGCFIVPNAWDVGSARLLEDAGFAALATTSAGVAFSLGYADHGYAAPAARVEREAMLERVREMASAIAVPLTADLEAGYGASPDKVAETIRKAIEAGASGGNIEDHSGNRQAPLYDFELAVDRIRAARAAIDASGEIFVLNARTDGLLVDPAHAFAECVRRANAFRAAGADCIFVPGAADRETIGRLVREIDAPLNVVAGLSGNALSLADLAELGVRRVTIGGSLVRALYFRIREAAKEMLERGTFTFADEQISQAELNRIFAQGRSR
jgi:2-methylisocitrate lyase-like PEP mutase family enzyme